jgi:protein TonB
LSAYRLPSVYERPPLRRRASGLGLALAVNLLLLLVLWHLGGRMPKQLEPDKALVVTLLPSQQGRSSEQPKKQEVVKRQTVTQPKPQPKFPNVLPVKPTLPAPPPTQVIPMSSDELAAADIRNLPKSSSGSGDEEDSQAVGTAPNGEALYAAEWARHPTNAELGGYLPHNAPDGYGLIACKTVAGDRVDNCVEIGQSPLGSGLARAVRLAAWQFRVRPPRKNGQAMVGSWVQIRIDYIGHDSGG